MLFENLEIFKNDSGIYKIKNNDNGKFYIGSASNFLARYKQHLSALKNNRHYNNILQHSYNKHGKEAYSFIILEITTGKTKEERLYVEGIYLKKYYDGGKTCYNLTLNAYSREGSINKTPEKKKPR
jgi:group I intron endonuclease